MSSYTAFLIKRDAAERRHARLMAAQAIGRHTLAEWREILARYDFRCVRSGYGEQFTGWVPNKDHIVPISLGGCDSATNLQPLCRQCNTAKRNDTTDWRAYRDANGWGDADYDVVR